MVQSEQVGPGLHTKQSWGANQEVALSQATAASRLLPCIPAPLSRIDELWLRRVSQINPFLHRLLLVGVFIAVIKSQL